MIIRDRKTNYLQDAIYNKELKESHILHGNKLVEKIKDKNVENMFFAKYEIVRMDETEEE